MGMFDSVTNVLSGGQQQGYEDLEKMLREGMGQFKQYAGQANALLDPFYQAGKGQMNPYMQNYQRLLDPQHFYHDMMNGYQTSPEAQRQMQMGTDAAMKAASASGMLGSTNLLNQVNENSQGIMRADQDNWFNKMSGMFNQGLGHQQGMVGMGYGAGGQMGNNLMNLGNALMQGFGNVGQAQLGQNMAQGQGLQQLAQMAMMFL